MIPENNPDARLTNRTAILSFTAGMLSLVSLCIAIVPIPFTGYICFPVAAVLAAAAMVGGLKGMRQTRDGREKGRTLAAVGFGIGFAAILGVLCVAAAGMALWSQLGPALYHLFQ